MYETSRIRHSGTASHAAAGVPARRHAPDLGAHGVDRPRQPDRGHLYPVHFSPWGSLPAGMGAVVPRLADRGLADPLRPAGNADRGHSRLRPGGGQLLYPAIAG